MKFPLTEQIKKLLGWVQVGLILVALISSYKMFTTEEGTIATQEGMTFLIALGVLLIVIGIKK